MGDGRNKLARRMFFHHPATRIERTPHRASAHLDSVVKTVAGALMEIDFAEALERVKSPSCVGLCDAFQSSWEDFVRAMRLLRASEARSV